MVVDKAPDLVGRLLHQQSLSTCLLPAAQLTCGCDFSCILKQLAQGLAVKAGNLHPALLVCGAVE